MARLEQDAGVSYEDVSLDNLTALSHRVFAVAEALCRRRQRRRAR